MVDKLLKELADYCDVSDVVYQISYIVDEGDGYGVEMWGNGDKAEDFAFAAAAADTFIKTYDSDIETFCERLKEYLKEAEKLEDQG